MPTYLHLGNLPIISASLSFRMRDCDGWRWETHKQSTPTPLSQSGWFFKTTGSFLTRVLLSQLLPCLTLPFGCPAVVINSSTHIGSKYGLETAPRMRLVLVLEESCKCSYP